MEGFTYETRKKLTDQWIAEFKRRGAGLGESQRTLLPAGEDYSISQKSCQWISETVERERQSLSWFYKTYLHDLVKACVGGDYEEEFYYALDQMNQFQMTAGWYRRSLRSEGYGPFARQSVSLLWAYSRLNFYGCSLGQLLSGQAGAEIYDHARTCRWSYAGILAAQIDRGNQETVQAVRDILLGEGNTAMTSYELIRGIVMSKSRALYELLGKFLLAARLQEGVRQAVCETMDAGRPEAFLHLFGVIEDNGLVRYSSVKRAVSTWIGIFSEKSTDRITDKLVRLMGRCLREREFCAQQLRTSDSIAISCGLWAKGFYNAEEAVEAELELIRAGTRVQKMTASYFNQSLQEPRLRMQAAKEVLMQYPEDLELAACFMPGFMPDTRDVVNGLLQPDKKGGYYWRRWDEEAREPARLPVSRYFDSREEALRLYGILKDLLKAVPQKGIDLNPCIFPWHRVILTRSQIAARLCLIAWMLHEEPYLDEAAQWIPGVGQGESYWGMSRADMARLLLYRPASGPRRRMIFELMRNPEEETRAAANRLAEALDLEEADYEAIEKNLKYKLGRENCLALLERQDSRAVRASVGRLLAARSEDCHMGALELALRVKERDQEGFGGILPLLKSFGHPTEKEQVLLEELTGQDSRAQDILGLPGYGLYDPGAVWALPQVRTDRREASGLFAWGDASCVRALEALDRLIGENRDREYQPLWGDSTTLGARLERVRSIYGDPQAEPLDAYPFKELWSRFYEREIGTEDRLIELYLYLRCQGRRQEYQRFSPIYKKVFGSGLLKKPPFERELAGLHFRGYIVTLAEALLSQYVSERARLRWALAAGAALFAVLKELPEAGLSYEAKERRWDNTTVTVTRRMTGLPIFAELLGWLKSPGEEWRESFAIRFGLDRLYRERKKKPDAEQGQAYVTLEDFVRCVAEGLWDRDMFLKAAFEYGEMDAVIGAASTVCQRGNLSSRQVDVPALQAFFGKGVPQPADGKYNFSQEDRKTPQMELARGLYCLVVPALLRVELRRGEKLTPFSNMAIALRVVYGIDTMIQLLTALGDDTLMRFHYYWRGIEADRQTVLCHLLKVSCPAPGETAADLKKALKGKKISKKRLVELAMYAPQWIPLLEEYLDMTGLKSGCYYFMAHTSEGLDEQAASVVAKYTPLSPEELSGGAFDVNWFFEAYHALGEENFRLLYDAAKYTSSGAAHARARKYADAALGKVPFQMLKAEIEAKRNKDLLMSAGLLPLPEERQARERSLLERYQLIETFRRQSRQFGAQRRASEGRACDLALRNLSVKAGFSDASRLTLRMEARLSKETEGCFDWLSLDGETKIRVEVDGDGKSRLACERAGKGLKALPARFKKDERVLEYQAVSKALKEQYSRTCRMMEQAMEEETVFEAWELLELMESPVARPILAPLVFGLAGAGKKGAGKQKLPEVMGFLTGEGLTDETGAVTKIPKDAPLVAVHPYHLFAAGRWHGFQRLLFKRQIRQPFKQVFRELYVKLEEEKDKAKSRMFSGNQIQPQKTVGALRSRRWVADYEDGLQKVYYRENIVARLYAMADWFSPSDIEAPTLEYVAFEDRKTFQPVKISQVPEILYSEVMRDVDLAVSVAHAGGVDPEASHSTVELRRAVVECSLELFGIGNVRLEGSHAYIEGRLGCYTVHLGSGVVHQTGNAMLYIVPVHSQHRGRMFLPFMDEDPKTAEILSKILLLAEDFKIKDPKILEQIR